MLPALAIATFLYIGAWGNQSKYLYRAAIILMFLFVVLRSGDISGGKHDYLSYKAFFEQIPTLSEFDWRFWDASFMYGYGWGYALLNSVAKTINDNYYCFQVIDTTLVFFLLVVVMSKLNLKYSEKCMFLFVYFCSKFIWYYFILLRQNIADLIIWYVFISWEPNRGHKWLMYLRDALLILVATSFHSTAGFMFFAYPIYIFLQRIKDNRIVFFSIIIAPIITLATTAVMPFIWNTVGVVAGERYLSNVDHEVGGINFINYALRIIYLLLIFLFGKNYCKYENSLRGTALALIGGSVNDTFGTRLVEYFAVGYYCGMSHLKGYMKKQERGLIFFGIYLVYIAFLLQYILVNNPKMIQYQMYAW